MARLLKRVLAKVAAAKSTGKAKIILPARPKRKSSLYANPPPRPLFSPSAHAGKSILLQEQNPIVHKDDFKRHKRLPPRVSVYKTRSQRHGDDSGRGMDDQERAWWSDPYLRMLASPLRVCLMSNNYLPTYFLIRLATMTIPPSRASSPRNTHIVVPDGLEHSKYRIRKSHRGFYILCRRDAILSVASKGSYKRVHGSLIMKSVVADQVAHLLRVRVLQEVDHLISQVKTRPRRPNDPPIIRRLTRAELQTLRDTGNIPYENAVAVIIVPPPNKNPTTKERPQPSMSALPPETPENLKARVFKRPQLPLSTLYLTRHRNPIHKALPGPFSAERVPFYNGVPLMPEVTQRAALHRLLACLLRFEWQRAYKPSRKDGDKDGKIQGDDRASHAFLLMSGADSAARADAAALAVALWRIRMFEGAGWDDPAEAKIIPDI